MVRVFRPLAFDYMAALQRCPVTVFPVPDHRPTAMHHHGPHVEIALVTGGKGEHLTELYREPLCEGDVVVMPFGIDHGYEACERLDLINVLFEPRELSIPTAWLRAMPGQEALFSPRSKSGRQAEFVRALKLNARGLERAVDLAVRIHDEVVEQKPGYVAAACSLLSALLVELGRHQATAVSPVSAALLRLTDLLEWLSERYSGDVTIEEMARRAHMSRSTLERYFHQAFGCAPGAYLTGLRLRRAADLLKHTSAPVAEVATSVGIPDGSYFARVFRQQLGMSPLAYRKRSGARRH